MSPFTDVLPDLASADAPAKIRASGRVRRRWVVERTFAWLNPLRRLRVRYDKRAEIREAVLSLGCVPICWHALRKSRASE
ncbi:MAG TPA: transposase [Vicinamibacterales bacterium]|nr:transposase [Vicinamibacterales bacterium]